MNESIARLSTGIRSMYGGDAAGQSIANSLGSRAQVLPLLQEMQRTVFHFFKLQNLCYLRVAALTTRLRELGIQYANKDLLTTTDEAALDAEAVAIGDAIDGIADNVKFNGTQLIGSVAGMVLLQLVLTMQVILQQLVLQQLSQLRIQIILQVLTELTEVLIQLLVKSLSHLVMLLQVCLHLRDTKRLLMLQLLT